MNHIHPGLTTWNGTDYAAGFRARLEEVSSAKNQPHSWQCGWEDAHRELLASDKHEQRLACGEYDDYGETWGLLFDAGGDARVNGIAFDERRTQPWKEGWIDADINFGMATSRV
ncbi:MAG: hypothetical protein ABSD72_09590 [Terracidiphilus sp.]|jgi:hypothetical protein